jgi:hypothetical protein
MRALRRHTDTALLANHALLNYEERGATARRPTSQLLDQHLNV